MNVAKTDGAPLMAESSNPAIHIIRRNIDEAAILAVLAKLNLQQFTAQTEIDEMVLAALRRSSEAFRNADIETTAEMLADYDADQVVGLTSNVKGILHELEFARIENEDGDQVLASLYPDTTHPGFDIQFQNMDTGETWSAQLKATDDVGYVEDWIDAHPDGEILVTEEIAKEMDLDSSGLSNEDLTVRVEDFVDRMIDTTNDDGMWDYFPALLPLAISMAMYELWRRYQKGEIDMVQFRQLSIHMSGLKAAKIGGIIILLGIPAVGFVTAVALVIKILISVRSQLA